MKRLITILGLIIVVLIVACNRSTPEVSDDNKRAENIEESTLSKGFQLLESNCFSCHSPQAGKKSRVAPPMMAIKKHYVNDETSLEQFTADLQAFLEYPTADKAKLTHAVEKFGLMPRMDFNPEEVKAIAAYIYHAEFEKPGWYKRRYASEKKKHAQSKGSGSYLEMGRKLAMQTKGVLGKNLLAALNEKGTTGALEFCATRAYPLTDSMATALNAKIKRVSDKNRNPENAANDDELAYIEAAKSQLAKGEKPTPTMHEDNGRMIGYYPIITNQMCLQCHGQEKEQVKPATLALLKELYPEDRATGYDVNELRGIWVVEMERDI